MLHYTILHSDFHHVDVYKYQPFMVLQSSSVPAKFHLSLPRERTSRAPAHLFLVPPASQHLLNPRFHSEEQPGPDSELDPEAKITNPFLDASKAQFSSSSIAGERIYLARLSGKS